MTLQIGIIGGGGIAAKLHVPQVQALGERARVALVAGRKAHRLKYFRDTCGAATTTRYDDVVEDPSIDAVIVSTPPNHHVEWGLKALAAGKHLLLEKPLSGRFADANALVEAAARTDRTVMCLPHFDDTLMAARELITAGALGTPSSAYARNSHGGPELYYHEVNRIFGEPPAESLWFFDREQAGVGALYDMGVYCVANLVALLGSARRVSAFLATTSKPATVDDTATVILEMANGVIATAATGWCDAGRSRSFAIHGDKAKLHAPGADGGPLSLHEPRDPWTDKRDIRVDAITPPPVLGSPHAHWLDCIERGIHPPLSHAWAARHVCEILQAAMQSAATGHAITLESAADAPAV